MAEPKKETVSLLAWKVTRAKLKVLAAKLGVPMIKLMDDLVEKANVEKS